MKNCPHSLVVPALVAVLALGAQCSLAQDREHDLGKFEFSGDTLVMLNSVSAEEYDISELGSLFRGSAPLQLVVERDGTRRTVEIP